MALVAIYGQSPGANDTQICLWWPPLLLVRPFPLAATKKSLAQIRLTQPEKRQRQVILRRSSLRACQISARAAYNLPALAEPCYTAFQPHCLPQVRTQIMAYISIFLCLVLVITSFVLQASVAIASAASDGSDAFAVPANFSLTPPTSDPSTDGSSPWWSSPYFEWVVKVVLSIVIVGVVRSVCIYFFPGQCISPPQPL